MGLVEDPLQKSKKLRTVLAADPPQSSRVFQVLHLNEIKNVNISKWVLHYLSSDQSNQ